MNEDDASVLSAWSKGEAGATTRIARRAWAVLQRNERVDPYRLATAVGGAGEAARWFDGYDAMGLVGLVDAPRSGRPAATLAKADASLLATGAGAPNQHRVAAKSLPRNEREALWRANRLAGRHLCRRHRYDLPLPAPAGIRDLGAVFIGPGLRVLVAVRGVDEVLDHPHGSWLDVSRTQALAVRLQTRNRPNVMSALAVGPEEAVTPTQAGTRNRINETVADTHIRKLLRRWVAEVAELSRTLVGRLEIKAVINLDQSPMFVEYLAHCRSACLWTPVKLRYPSPIARHDPVVHRGAWDSALFTALQKLSPKSSGEDVERLTASLANPSILPFAWVRDPSATNEEIDSAETSTMWIEDSEVDD